MAGKMSLDVSHGVQGHPSLPVAGAGLCQKVDSNMLCFPAFPSRQRQPTRVSQNTTIRNTCCLPESEPSKVSQKSQTSFVDPQSEPTDQRRLHTSHVQRLEADIDTGISVSLTV